jgi:hypothetical protein
VEHQGGKEERIPKEGNYICMYISYKYTGI